MKIKIKRDTSFSQKKGAGWTREQLMTYYALSDVQYDKVLASLETIRNERNKAGKAVV